MFSFCLVFCVGILCLNHVFLREDSRNKNAHFLEADRNYDVLFFGTSHVMDAIYPTELYEQTGLRSYNLGNAAETLEATLWTMRCAFDLHVPKVAVIDVAYVDKVQAESSATYSLSHLFYDSWPLSIHKIKAIHALFPRERQGEFLFPLIAYHSRWEELMTQSTERICDSDPFMYGAELRAGREEPAEYERTQECDFRETPGKRALSEIVALCREKGVEPVLVGIPYPAEKEKQEIINSVAALALDWQVPFLNLFDQSDLVDFTTDCYDPQSHLNPDGAVKVTRYLGTYLKETYDFSERLSETEKEKWEADLQLYKEAWREKWQGSSLL